MICKEGLESTQVLIQHAMSRSMVDKFEIVDAHFHLWKPETHHWLREIIDKETAAGNTDFDPKYLIEPYQKDITGYNVAQCVHVEAAWSGDPVGETKWLDELADSNSAGFPNAIVGFCDLSSSDAVEILKRHIKSKRFRGIRHNVMLNYHPDTQSYSIAEYNYLTDSNWLKGFGLLEKYQLSFELMVLPKLMHLAAEVVRQHPNVMVMIDHCGLPCDRDEGNMKTWRQGLQEFAKYPNVYCKVFGLFHTDPKWDQKSVESVVKPVLEIFGIDRCVFASNFPVDRLNGTPHDCPPTLLPGRQTEVLQRQCQEVLQAH